MFIIIPKSQLNVLLWALVETSCIPQKKEFWLKNNLMKEKSSGFPRSLKVTHKLCMWWGRGEAVFGTQHFTLAFYFLLHS